MPPARSRSAATKRPPGFKSANVGVRLLTVSKSSMVSGTPTSRAIASRWSTAFVDPPQAYRRDGNRLVAGGESDDRVEEMAAADQLDGVGDDLPANEAGLHPLRAHGDAVADGHGVELHRRAAGGADAVLDVHRQL